MILIKVFPITIAFCFLRTAVVIDAFLAHHYYPDVIATSTAHIFAYRIYDSDVMTLDLDIVSDNILLRENTSGARYSAKESRTITVRPYTSSNTKTTWTCGCTLGFELPYESALNCLKSYHQQHGDLVIPRRYVVPSNEHFPPEWHGKRLAETVYDMKWWTKHVHSKSDRVLELNELGFVWSRLQEEWNLVLEALITFSQLHGHINVGSKFVVPFGDDTWPKATWGLNLGNCVHRIRVRNDYLRDDSRYSRRKQLDGLGFVWDSSESAFQKFFDALQHYAKLEGNNGGRNSVKKYRPLKIPVNFVIPSNSDAWPKELWSYPLGSKCNAVRTKELYVKNNYRRAAMLEDVGFHWNGNVSLCWLEIVHASAIYSKINGKVLDVPTHFKVPEKPWDCDCGEWPWPEHLWGFPLGQRLKAIRLKGTYLNSDPSGARKAQLDGLGFVWNPKQGRKKRSLGDWKQVSPPMFFPVQ